MERWFVLVYPDLTQGFKHNTANVIIRVEVPPRPRSLLSPNFSNAAVPPRRGLAEVRPFIHVCRGEIRK